MEISQTCERYRHTSLTVVRLLYVTRRMPKRKIDTLPVSKDMLKKSALRNLNSLILENAAFIRVAGLSAMHSEPLKYPQGGALSSHQRKIVS